jgi:hypothetical protein
MELTDKQITFLSETYIKLQKNPRFQKLSKEFRDFMIEYLEEEIEKNAKIPMHK